MHCGIMDVEISNCDKLRSSMKTLKSARYVLSTLGLVLILLSGSVAEARLGGGRSSGSRGFRGFGSRSYQTTPNRPYTSPYGNNYQSQQAAPRAPEMSSRPFGGSFTRGLVGGLAGGFLGSMLFRSMGYAGQPGGGFGGGFGMLELIVLLGLGYLIFRVIAGRKFAAGMSGHRTMSHYDKLHSVEPGPFAQSTPDNEDSRAERLRKYDPGFDLQSFKEERMDDVLLFQTAWGQRDISRIADRLAPELLRQIQSDLENLKAQGRINRVENIAVRATELVEAWQEYGKEYATLRIRANVTDYTIEEATGQVVEGDRQQSVKFEEDWTFVRDLDDASRHGAWKLSAIEV